MSLTLQLLLHYYKTKNVVCSLLSILASSCPPQSKGMYPMIMSFQLFLWPSKSSPHTYKVKRPYSTLITIFYTEHKPLKHFQSQPYLNHRQAHWLQFFYESKLHFVYKPGKQCVITDALSHRPDHHHTGKVAFT